MSLSNSWENHLSDPKKLFLVFVFLGVGLLVFVGDRTCFTRASESIWEKYLAYPTAWGYQIFEDRVFANAFAFLIWSLIAGGGSVMLIDQIERRWIEPMMMKKTIQQLEREKKWINKLGKDLF